MRIVFTGGGTGGHFYPLLAVAQELRQIAENDRILDVQLYYIGPEYKRELLLQNDIVPEFIPAGKDRRNIIDILNIIRGTLFCFWKLFLIMPDVVFSKGGYGSFPVLLVARIYRIPVIIHESDVIPGKVSRWSAKFARRIGLGFEKTAELFPQNKVAVVGVPISKKILGGLRDESREHYSVFTTKPVLLVLGSSQGALPLNQLVLSGLPQFIQHFEIIHQTGDAHFADVKEQAAVMLNSITKGLYHPIPSYDDPKYREILAAADFVIARASATTIFEIAAAGKPSILIPLPHAAQNHQRANAYEYAKASSALVVEQANATPSLVLNALLRAFEAPEELKRMREGAQRFSRVDSGEVVAREILALALKH